ncbi:hypothetical protein DAEQUDRAFT_767246 [Daedalea quercina L-15889]|uniref:F-box domain-containing protein n=1 Tax=Daedalea quercina L-15889 TaxID=1314783 RepID=A0A165NT17_9APHY|nr:hypothetical protein DAEQUDRAFT_767246 [Daedalea quercina L-15889]
MFSNFRRRGLIDSDLRYEANTSRAPDEPQAPYCLAPEVVDRILDHLWAEPRALKMCSLTCSGWLPTTRRHLFRTIRIRSSYFCVQFASLILSRTAMPITFLPCVREIILQDSPLRNVDVKLASRAFRRLRNVETLNLAFWPAVDLPTAFMEDMCLSFPNVIYLRMDECDIMDPVHFVQLVCGFPRLSRIHVEDQELLQRSDGPCAGFDRAAMESMRPIVYPKSLNKRTTLPDLVIERLDLLPSKQCFRLAAVLCQPRFKLRLRYLRVNWSCRRLSPLIHMLDNIGDALEEIVFAVEGNDIEKDQSWLADQIKKLTVTNVRSLTIGKANLSSGMNENTFNWVPVLIRHVLERSRHLVDLHFHLRFEEDLTTLDAFPWTRLDRLFLTLPARYIGRGVYVQLHIWVPAVDWVRRQGIYELGKSIRGKMPRSQCGMRFLDRHKPRGYEQGSVEYDMVLGLPTI